MRDLPVWNEHDGRALEALAGLRELFEDADLRYRSAKRERHALDFLDLELGAIRLLREHPPVASQVRAAFRHLMVDEAQDINPAQAELIRLVAGHRGRRRPPAPLPRRRREAVDLPLPRRGCGTLRGAARAGGEP